MSPKLGLCITTKPKEDAREGGAHPHRCVSTEHNAFVFMILFENVWSLNSDSDAVCLFLACS